MPSKTKNIFLRGDGRYEVRYRYGKLDRRRFFGSRADAERYVEEAQNNILRFGQMGLELKANQFHRLMAALHELAPDDPTKGLGILEKLIQVHRERPVKTDEDVTILTVAESLYASWEGTQGNAAYRRNAKAIIRRFASEFGATRVDEMTPADVKAWVLRQSLGNQLTSKARVSLLFSHASAKRWLGKHQNPCKEFTLPTVTREPVTVPNPESLCRYLTLAAKEYRSVLPYLVVRLFAGLRACEVKKIKWSDFNCERRVVKVRQKLVAAKNGRGRSIPMAENLALWLRSLPDKEGSVASANVTQLEAEMNERFRQLEGFKPGSDLAKMWRNALRHSYASYRLGKLDDDLDALAKELGNGPEVAMGHYVGSVTAEDETRFWHIVPRGNSLLPVIVSIAEGDGC